MSPQISKGNAVIIKDIEPNTVKVGEVIIFRDPEHKEDLVIHKAVQVGKQGGVKFFSTRAINNPAPDNWKISAGEVIGGAAVKLPAFGAFLDSITTPRGDVSIIAIPAAGP